MKKLFVLVAFFAFCAATATAQDNKQAGDPAQMIEKYKERVKPLLMESAKLTEAEADKVITLHFTYSRRLQTLKDAPEDERKKQAEVLQLAENKEYTAIPLTEEKIKAVNEFWAEQKKLREKRQEAKKKNG